MSEQRPALHPLGQAGLLARLGPPPIHAIVLTAGGLSSTVVAHWLAHVDARVTLLTCTTNNPPQRGAEFATTTASSLGFEHHVVDLSAMQRAIPANPDADEIRAAGVLTAVSNAMAIMLDLGVALAVSRGADAVQVGVNADDAVLRPECDPSFLAAITHQAGLSNPELSTIRFRVHAPLIGLSIAEVVLLGDELDVPFEQTWSCHRTGPTHCGDCTGCRRRRGAVTAAGLTDPAA